jgi:hypothetical protein
MNKSEMQERLDGMWNNSNDGMGKVRFVPVLRFIKKDSEDSLGNTKSELKLSPLFVQSLFIFLLSFFAFAYLKTEELSIF